MTDQLPQVWTTAQISELCDVPKEKGSESVTPYLEIGNVSIVSKDYTLTEKPSVKGCRIAKRHDVLVSKVRPTRGAITYVRDEELHVSSAFTVLRNKGAMAEKYLWMFLAWNHNYLNHLGEKCTGTMYPTTSDEVIVDFEVPLAPLNEQRRIVAKLEKLLTKVETCQARLNKIPTLLKSFRQSVLAAACSGRLTADLQKHPQIESSSPTQEIADDLPSSWIWKPIQDLASAAKGSIQSGPFGSNLLHSEFQSTGILAIGIDNVLDGKFSFGRQHRISSQKYETLKKYAARPLDVLVTVMATVGRCCVVPADIETAIITKHVYRITINKTILNPYFLMHCIRGCPAVLVQVQGEIQGVTRPGINGTILKEIRIPLPPLAEQQEIVRRVEALFKIADQIEERCKKATVYVDKLTQSILAKAFRGELFPQDPNAEPSSELLKRIKGNKEKESLHDKIEKEKMKKRV